jgi:hypothetical protein
MFDDPTVVEVHLIGPPGPPGAAGLTPEQFGAIGNGDPAYMANDTHGWQAAIDESAATGVPITAGPKTYIIDGYKGDKPVWTGGEWASGGLILRDGVTIRGAGMGKTILKNGAANWRCIFRCRGGSFSLRDVTLDGDFPAKFPVLQSTTANPGTSATHGSVRGEGLIFSENGIVPWFEIVGVEVKNTGHYGIGPQNCSIDSGLIESCRFQNIGADCIDVKDYTPPAAGYKRGLEIRNVVTMDGCNHHYEDRYVVGEGYGNSACFNLAGGVTLRGAYIYNLECYGATQAQQLGCSGVRGRGTVTGVVNGNRLGLIVSDVHIYGVADGVGAENHHRVYGIDMPDANMHVSHAIIERCFKGVTVAAEADSNIDSGSLIDITIRNCTGAGVDPGVGLDISAGTKGLFGRNIDISGCDIGFQSTGNNSDMEMRIADSSLCHVQAADNILGNSKFKFSFFRPNVTPSLGDFDPAVSPIAASSQVAGVSPLTVIFDGEVGIIQPRKAYLNLYATANDEAWSGADAYLGGVQVYGADASGLGAGIKSAIRCRTEGSSGGTTKWEFTAQNAAAADISALWITSDRVRSFMPVVLPKLTKATLPAAASFDAAMVMITDPVGSKQLVFSDGTAWRYPDGTAV